MSSLELTLRKWGEGSGRVIDIPFRGLADRVTFRTGQVLILSGDAGSGKSTFCANWAWRMNQPALYLAQEDPFSTIQVFAALATDMPKGDVYPEDHQVWADRIGRRTSRREELSIKTHAHTLDELEARLIAHQEWIPPSVVFIDSLFDLKIEGFNYMETGYWAVLLPALKQLAIAYDVAFVCQHHAKREGRKSQGEEALTLGSLLFGGEKEAAHVWGIYHDSLKRHMYIQILKQRNGNADPSGGLYETVDWSPPAGRIFSR